MGIGRPDRRLTKDVAGERALHGLGREGSGPVRRREFEDAMRGPSGQEAEQVAEIGPRFEAVKLAAGEQRYEGAVGLAAVVAAEEQPVLPADRLAPELPFRDVVVYPSGEPRR